MYAPSLKLLDEIINITHEAAKAILKIYETACHTTYKSDGSPLSTADLISHQIIVTALERLTPERLIVSEEGASGLNLGSIPETFWLVDPLDGTKEFIQHRNEFTVNIALIQQGTPVLGVVCAPALRMTYAALLGDGAYKLEEFTHAKQPIKVSIEKNAFSVVGSRSHDDAERITQYFAPQPIAQFTAVGSSLKFCYVADGSAQAYLRLGRTMEWDTAAGQAVVVAAGGFVDCLNDTPLKYGKKNFENPPFIVRTSLKNKQKKESSDDHEAIYQSPC